MAAKIFWVVVGAVFAAMLLGAGLFLGKGFLDKKAMERSYRDGMQPVQETFTEYLLDNYEGVTAIEWQGVEVEWRDSPIEGPSLFGNGVSSDFKVYVNDKDYVTSYLWLTDEMDYDNDLERYVPNGAQTPENMDVTIEIALRQAISDLDGDPNGVFAGFRKSEEGSPDAKVVYNLDVFDFDFERKY